MNDILLKRICYLIAVAYAVSKESVWGVYLQTNSLDKTLQIIAKIK